MNVLLAAGPESTTLFTITVQGCGGFPGRFVGQHRMTVPLNRLQATHRRLLLAGGTILSVTRCQPMGDPPPRPHPGPAPDNGESPSPAPFPLVSVPPAEETELPRQVEHVPTPAAHQDQPIGTGASLGEDAMLLLLSVFGVLTLLTLQVAQSLAQQWAQQWGRTHAQAQPRSDPAAAGAWKRESANLRLGQLLRRARTS